MERFVGREAVLAAIDDLLQGTRSGQPTPLLVTGTSGAGKSMLARRVGAVAAEQEFTVLWIEGDGHGDAGHGPFDALRRAARAWPKTFGGDGRHDLLAPLHAVLGGAARAERAAVTDATRLVLEGMSLRRPVLVVVDDLQFADDATADLVLFLMRHLRRARVMVMATYRREDPARTVLDDLDRSHAAGRLVRLDLGPFDDRELAALVAAHTGHAPDADLVAVLQERTGGQPFFASQLVDSLVEQGLVHTADGTVTIGRRDLPLPRRVATTVLHRVFSLGPDARQVATVVALLGRVAVGRLPVLAAVTGITTERTDEAFDLLVRTGILDEDAGAYRFAHAILRDAVRTDLDPTARRRLHDRIATALSEHRAADPAQLATEIGEHVRRGTGGHDVSAARLLVAAGDAVLDVDPARSASAWYRDALARLHADDPLVATVQIRLASALDRGGRRAEAARVAGAALNVLAPGHERARAAIVAAHAAFAGGRPARAADILDGALAEPATATTRLVLHRARLHAWQGQRDDAARLLDRATAGGVPPDDPMVHTVRAMLSIGSGQYAAARASIAALRSPADAASAAARHNAALAACIATAVHFDPADAISDAADVDIDHSMGGWFHSAAAWALLRAGRLDDAIAAGEQACRSSDPGDLLAGLAAAAVVIGHLERDELEPAAARAAWARTIRGDALAYALDIADARLLAARGHTARAQELLGRTRCPELGAEPVVASALVLGEQVELAVLAGDLATARARNADLQQLPRDPCAIAVTMRCLLGDALTSADAAAARAAHDFAGAHGLQLDAAWALAIAGSRGADEDALITAHDELGRLGAHARQRRVARRLRALGRRVAGRPRTSRGTLGAVELEVSGHVADGLTNRQIGAVMNLSPKTIEVYLSRIYAKTGCRSRVELAVAVRAGRMVPPA